MGISWSANVNNVGPKSAVDAVIFIDADLLVALGGWEAPVELTVWAGSSHRTRAIYFLSRPAGERTSDPVRGKIVMLRQPLGRGFENKKIFLVFDRSESEAAVSVPAASESSGTGSETSPAVRFKVAAEPAPVTTPPRGVGTQVFNGPARMLLGFMHNVAAESSLCETAEKDGSEALFHLPPDFEPFLGTVTRAGLTAYMCPDYG